MDISLKDIFSVVWNGNISLNKNGIEIKDKNQNRIKVDSNGIMSKINGNTLVINDDSISINGKKFFNSEEIHNKSEWSLEKNTHSQIIKINDCVYKNVYKNDELIVSESTNCSKTYEEYLKSKNSWF